MRLVTPASKSGRAAVEKGLKGYPPPDVIHANEGGRETTPPGAEIGGSGVFPSSP